MNEAILRELQAAMDAAEPVRLIPGEQRNARSVSTPAFPIDALPERVKEICNGLADSLTVDPAMIAMPLLAGFGTAIGATHQVRIKSDWTEYLILWVLIVAPPGSKKSPALDAVFNPLKNLQTRYLQDYQLAKTAYAAQLQEYKARSRSTRVTADATRSNSEPPQEPVCRRVLIQDATPESVIKILSENPRGVACILDELTTWPAMGRYSNNSNKGSQVGPWLSMYDATMALLDRKGSGTVAASRAWLSIVAATQPGTAVDCLSGANMGNGLTHRLAVICPEERPAVYPEPEIPSALLDDLNRVYERLFALGFAAEDRPRELTLTPDAKVAFDAWRQRHHAERSTISEIEGEAWSKHEARVPRIAGILHLLDRVCRTLDAAPDRATYSSSEISVEVVERAIQIVEYLKGQTRLFYPTLRPSSSGETANFDVQELSEMGGRVSKRDYQRRHPKLQGTKLDEHLQPLIQAGVLRLEEVLTGAHPRTDIVLTTMHPAPSVSDEGGQKEAA